MMQKVFAWVGVFVISIVGIYLAAGRNLNDLSGLVRASADKTVSELEEQIPQDVHDRKLQQDLNRVREEIVDRKVQLKTTQFEINKIEESITQLEESLKRRKALLTEAYPILEKAVKKSTEVVKFANAEFTLDEFKSEIDDLLRAQELEQQRLDTQQSGLKQLTASAEKAEIALAEMQRVLENAEQEVSLLKSRREQAEIEAQTLELVNTQDEASGSAASLQRLRDEVTRIEAENEARRELAPASSGVSSNKLNAEWDRMEALRKLQESQPDTE